MSTMTKRALAEGVVGAAEIGLTVAGAPVLRHWFNRCGATAAEVEMPLPGDDLVPRPKMGYTRAITIHAPVEWVWPWLAQIGHDRGGLYSFEALENLVGCDMRNAERVLPEHQSLAVGDVVRLGPTGYPWFTVMEVGPPTTLVLLGADPRTQRPPSVERLATAATAASTWQWQLRPIAGGATRLVVRQRLTYPPNLSVLWHVTEPVAFVMERKMLLGIKARAEGAVRTPAVVAAAA